MNLAPLLNHFWDTRIRGNNKFTIEASMEKTLQLDLKSLPPNLKYSYSGDKEILPIIISGTLSWTQEDMILEAGSEA